MRRQGVHKRFMLAAFVASTLFLVSYVIYHSLHGDTPFQGVGVIRRVYFFILISHILLTTVALPLILITFAFALTGKFAAHRKIARFTLPAWLYVSVTGVLIFVFLRLFQ
jgi:putative membrane protein